MESNQDQCMTAPKADHLCVLVHGLWGKPAHMGYIEASLRERHHGDHLYILNSERNTGNLTYDGIEVCGERLAHEIEEALDSLATQGYRIRKFSIVGYSLGGLISRYALGLLFARGWLDKLEPVNFTTFASPHLGVRAPIRGARDLLFNGLGARTVSASGKQMFMIDTFQDSGKPLLAVLADPKHIFLQALAKFKHRTVYGNVVNDRTTAFYTTIFSAVDHFRDPENLRINYVKDYEPVVVNPDMYTLPAKKKEPAPFFKRVRDGNRRFFNKLPFWLAFSAIAMIGIPIFLSYSVIETCRSQERRRIHEEGQSATLFRRYRTPGVVKRVRTVIEEVFESAASRQDPDYLSSSSVTPLELEYPLGWSLQPEALENAPDAPNKKQTADNGENQSDQLADKIGTTSSGLKPLTLALTADQFFMIKSLNAVGFRKYPIYIHEHMHTHAAIIVRIQKEGFHEGRIVVKHWLDHEFVL